jgi:molybdenum-dependent DNA-binding transcriptional regulator ModE
VAVTLTQIRAFLAVKGTGSVHGAAGQLLVSQPSVSAAVASLARELGTVLVERHRRGTISPGRAVELEEAIWDRMQFASHLRTQQRAPLRGLGRPCGVMSHRAAMT